MKKVLIKLSAVLLVLTFLVAPISPDINSPFALAVGARDVPDSKLDKNEFPGGIVITPSAGAKPVSEVYPHKTLKSYIKKNTEKNSDVKGWLIVPGTNINKPVLYSSKDNDYYVYRDVNGINYPGTNYKNFSETANYLDFRTRFGDTWKTSSRNTVIYGHNWTNLREPLDIGSNNKHIMFGQLPSYSNIDFVKANPHIYYSTESNEGIWRVFCVAYVELSESFNYNAPNPKTEDYEALLKELKARSMYEFDVDLKSSDRILTLSTCTRQFDQGANQRFIVVARLLRNGESENDTVSVSVNKSMKKPSFKKA